MPAPPAASTPMAKISPAVPVISGVMKDVYRVLRDSGLADVIGKDNIFPASPSNPNVATRNALKRAQQILGTNEADVKIFFDPAKKKED